jgi:GMP synthase-like glutamine amidotransferase
LRVVAFRHVPFEDIGLIRNVLDARAIDVEYADPYLDAARIPDVAHANGLIFMGGPMSVNDNLPYLHQEMRLIAKAVERRQPVLGICLGAQLIAGALGAKVYRNPQKEIGWFDIHLTADAADAAVFASMESTETVFHWHGETFDLPHGAVLLASSDRCRHQAFRVDDQVYGLQFHLEVTPEIISDWCIQDANCGDVQELDAPIDPRHNAVRLASLSAAVFGRWCDLI